jgi:hypothetical protein
MLLMAFPLLATMLLAYQGLSLWVGASFAQNSASTAKILVVGVVVNAMAKTPFVFVQGAGRAKWTAVLHLFEFPFYALGLWLFLRAGGGIQGAACAWSARIIIDAVALYVMAARLEPGLRQTAVRDLAWVGGGCVLALCLDRVLGDVSMRLALMLVVALVCGIFLLTQLNGARPALAKRNT